MVNGAAKVGLDPREIDVQGSAEALLELAGLSQQEIMPIADAMERGGRFAAAAAVCDEILDKCEPIAGTPADCLAAIEGYSDVGCTQVVLELWGEDRGREVELFAADVLPHLGR
jgi:5,10-methylenetetrahydromethanopterin reductase